MSLAIRQLIQQGAFDQALAALPDFRVLRNDAERLYLRGISHAALNQQAEALRCAERGVELEPDEVRFHMLLASLLMGSDPERARQTFVQVISLNPNLPEAHAGLGHLAAQRGAIEQAESQYRTALRAQADHAPTLLAYARLLLANKRIDEGLALVNQVLRREPHHPDAQALAGRALMVKGNLEFARKALDNALAIAPEHADALLYSAQLRLRESQPLPGLEEIGRLLRLRPRDAGVLLLGSEIALQAQDEVTAMALLTRLVQAHPRHELGVLKLADLMALKNSGAAAGILARHARGMPESSHLWRALINLLRDNGALHEALAQAQAWTEASPQTVDGWNQRALLAEYFEDFEQANDAARRAVRLDPLAPEATLVLARTALRERRPGEALAALESLVLPAAGAQRHEAERARGRALLDLGRIEAALQAYRAAAEAGTLDPMPAALPREVERPTAVPTMEAARHPPLWFLVGAPGSGVEALGRFLAAQPDAHVLTDRYSRKPRRDWLGDPASWSALLQGKGLESARKRYLRSLIRLELRPGQALYDWLPQLDVRAFDLLRVMLPEARFLVVQRDPRDALLHAVTQAAAGPDFADPQTIATAIAHQTIHFAQILATHGAPVVSMGFEQLQASPRNALERLALAMHRDSFQQPQALDLTLRERGGLDRYLPAGSWSGFANALAPAIQRLG